MDTIIKRFFTESGDKNWTLRNSFNNTSGCIHCFSPRGKPIRKNVFKIPQITAVIIVSCRSAISGLTRNPYLDMYRPSPDRYNYFDAELLEVLCREEGGNVVMSPISIKLVLGMLLEGSGGISADEIEGALRIMNSNSGLQQELKQRLFSIQRQTDGDHLKIANRVFMSEKFRINPAYASSLKQNYGSDVVPVRFNYPRQTAEALNSWVAEATSEKIKKLVDESQIGNDAKLILANAIYFKGNWETPFSPQKTVQKCFYTSPNKCTKVPLMTDTDFYDFGYVAKLDAYAINLPYEGGKFSMIIVLPNKRHGHIQLSRDMIHVSLDEIMSHMAKEKIEVEIPRFAAEFNNDFVGYLKKLHISHVFGENSNLSGVYSGRYDNASITNIFHSAKIEVDERGTVAAASTGALFVALMGDTKKSFTADHPFLFFVRDSQTGTVLFSGKIEQPQEAHKAGRFGNSVIFAGEQSPTNGRTLETDYFHFNSPSASSHQKPQWYPIQYRSDSWNPNLVTFYNTQNRRA